MKLLVLFSLFIAAFSNTHAQNCPPNIDFEEGSFNGWQCYIGSTSDNGSTNSISLNTAAPTPTRHELISITTPDIYDEYGGFSKLCPYGGRYSVKLGNDQSNSRAEGISFTFTIPASADTFSLTYFYAVVFQDPGHDHWEQPRFFVSAYDVVTGELINCASYNYIATASIPGFQRSTVDTSVWYKNWSPASIDFSGLAGRQVRLEVKTADCTLGAHFGYAYVDVGTGCGGLITAAALCGASNNSVLLSAPYGFQSYTWYNANYTTVVGNQQVVSISPPPPTNTLFHVDMIPYPGYGCRDTSDALVTTLPIPDTPVVENLTFCQFQQATPLTATTTEGNILQWYTSATGGTGSHISPVVPTSTAGVFSYWVSQKALFGCESPKVEVLVTVSPTPVVGFSINDNRQCEDNNQFLFNPVVSNTVPTSIYSWDFDDDSTSNQPVAIHTYNAGGSYNVELTVENPGGCRDTRQLPVYVIGKPLVNINYPAVICANQTSINLTVNTTVPGGAGVVNQWHWEIGNNVYNQQTPPTFTHAAGNIPVRLFVETTEGCRSDTSVLSLAVRKLPVADFSFTPPCENETIRFTNLSRMPAGVTGESVVAWSWQFVNGQTSTIKNPALNLPDGQQHVLLTAESNLGCKSITLDRIIAIYEKPSIDVRISDSCVFRNISYDAISLGNNQNAVTNWYWKFGNRFEPGPSSLLKSFSTEGQNSFWLVGESVHGCKDTIYRPFKIYQNHAFAGEDTIAAMGQPVYLNAGGEAGDLYTWTPSAGLNNPSIANPIATYDQDQLYQLDAISKYGCDAHSNILIKRYKGPELYIPSAFTPNDDGRNDKLKVFPVGIKQFYSFEVYNRNGVRLYYSTDYFKGWNGTYNGQKVDIGNYVVVAKALDYRGKMMLKKVNVLVLR